MAGAIGFENFASGIGGVTVVAYFSALCDLRFTASQYALISAAASIVGRFLTGTSAGALVEGLGYVNFYLLTTLAAVPGILLFWWMMRMGMIDSSIGTAGVVGKASACGRGRRGSEKARLVRRLIVGGEHLAGEVERAEDQDDRTGSVADAAMWPRACSSELWGSAAKPSFRAIAASSPGSRLSWSVIGTVWTIAPVPANGASTWTASLLVRLANRMWSSIGPAEALRT